MKYIFSMMKRSMVERLIMIFPSKVVFSLIDGRYLVERLLVLNTLEVIIIVK